MIEYVEHVLAGEYRLHVPFYRSGLAAFERLAHDRFGTPFTGLSAAQQDAVLAQAEGGDDTGAFFETMRTHALEGMFGDPRWGGNADGVGWKLLGYPGPRREWSEAEQRLDARPGAEVAPVVSS